MDTLMSMQATTDRRLVIDNNECRGRTLLQASSGFVCGEWPWECIGLRLSRPS